MSQLGFPSRDFTRLWWAESVSTLGSNVTMLALSTMVVLTLDGSAQDVGWLGAARWLPYLVLGLVVGALVDRSPRRPVLLATDLVRAVIVVTVPVAWAADRLSIPFLLVVVTCLGTATLINDAAFMSLLPRVVPRAHLQSAHARIDTTDAVAQTAGPAVGGLVIKLVGAPLALLVDAVSYLVSAVLVLTLRVSEVRRTPIQPPHVMREIREGVQWVYRGSGLATLAWATHLWFVANALLATVIAPYALITLGLSPLQFGLAAAAAGAGSICGAVASGAGGRRLGTGWSILTAHSATTLGVCVMALAGLSTTAWAAAGLLGVGQLLHGFGLGFSNSHEMAYRQALTPDELQARTNITMRSFNRAIMVVVAPLGGLLAVQTSNRLALVCSAGVFAAVVVVLAMSPVRTVRAEHVLKEE